MTNAISTRPDAHAAMMARPTYDAKAGTIEIPTPYQGGMLTFSPSQKTISAEQLVVLSPLGVEANWSPPYVMAFLAECHARGLDPWRGEAYLMKYPGEKYIRHIGIAGMRKHAARTRQYLGSDPIEYSDADGQWSQLWPHADKVPYAARVTVYRQNWRPTTVIALYDEYCPLEEEKRWDERAKRKVPTGRGKIPTPMWRTARDGGKPTVMLGKCAEAAALRRAFPDEFNGFYEPAEFERAAHEVADWDAEQGDTARERRAAYDAAHAAGPVTDARDIGVEVTEAEGEPAVAPLTPAAARALLLGELAAQARILGAVSERARQAGVGAVREDGTVDTEWLTRKWSAARGGAVFAEASLEDIAAHVARFREFLVSELRASRRGELADRYAAAPFGAYPLEALFGTDEPWAVEPDPEPAVDEPPAEDAGAESEPVAVPA